MKLITKYELKKYHFFLAEKCFYHFVEKNLPIEKDVLFERFMEFVYSEDKINSNTAYQYFNKSLKILSKYGLKINKKTIVYNKQDSIINSIDSKTIFTLILKEYIETFHYRENSIYSLKYIYHNFKIIKLMLINKEKLSNIFDELKSMNILYEQKQIDRISIEDFEFYKRSSELMEIFEKISFK